MVATCFTVGPVILCVDRALLRGILEDVPVTPVPGAPPWLLGACNRGGRALAVLDVALLAGLTRVPGVPRAVVVVETPAGPVGLCAEALPDEQRGATPTRTGELLLAVVPGTWMVDLARLPAFAENALHPARPAL